MKGFNFHTDEAFQHVLRSFVTLYYLASGAHKSTLASVDRLKKVGTYHVIGMGRANYHTRFETPQRSDSARMVVGNIKAYLKRHIRTNNRLSVV